MEASAISLSVRSADGNEVLFKVGFNLPLGILMSAYCDRQCIGLSNIYFIHDDCILLPSMTPAELGLRNGNTIAVVPRSSYTDHISPEINDQIDVQINRIIREQAESREENRRRMVAEAEELKAIPVIDLIVRSADGNDVLFKMRINSSLNILTKAYCDRQCINPRDALFSYDGYTFASTMTPQELGLKNNDIINVTVQSY